MLFRRGLSELVSATIMLGAVIVLVLTLSFGVPVFGAVTAGSGSPQGATVSQYQYGPTSKEDCKKGGWKQFGFKNQGQCIKYVNHHP